MFDLAGRTILVTGGTGSFGKSFVHHIITNHPDTVVRVFSRDELKQSNMAERFGYQYVRYLIGDVRDRDRLIRAAQGVDCIVHAAAMKQVPACEYNPFEAVRTNIEGAQNVVDAAIAAGVGRVVALSTDKAVNPVNLYGATKLCAEKIFVQGNAYAPHSPTRFACVRYGNVLGSRGSVVPTFIKQRQSGRLTVTDRRMTRFWISLDQAVELALFALEHMVGGEVFVPKLPAVSVMVLAEAVAPGIPIEFVGIRPGEKLHEVLLTSDEARHSVEVDDTYVVFPEHHWWSSDNLWHTGLSLRDDFVYASNSPMNPQLSVDDVAKLVEAAGTAGYIE